MTKNRVFPVALLASVAASGCDGALSLEDFLEETGNATCEKLFECCTPAEIADLGDGFLIDMSSVEDCQETYSTALSLSGGVITDAVDEGRMGYDSTKAEACLDVIGALTCEAFRATDTANVSEKCDNPFIPQVEAGGSCALHAECIGGPCEGASGNPGAVDGTCTPLPDEGEVCDFRCRAGLLCLWDADANESRCVVPPGLGETCTSICEGNLQCIYDSTTQVSTCREPPAIGEACTTYCQAGAYCDIDSGLCAAQLSNGLACDNGGECEGGLCDAGVCATATTGGACGG
jgi:hypothetical protein